MKPLGEPKSRNWSRPSWWRWRQKADRTWMGDYITFIAKDLQVFLSLANAVRSERHEWGGASIRMLPGTPILCCSATAWKMRRDGPALKICPNHLNLRIRIALTRSKVHVACRASCGMVWSTYVDIFFLNKNVMRLYIRIKNQIQNMSWLNTDTL